MYFLGWFDTDKFNEIFGSGAAAGQDPGLRTARTLPLVVPPQ